MSKSITTCLLFILLANIVWAQLDLIEEMRSKLEGGFYASAAQIDGPALITAFPESAEAHYLYSYALYLVGNLNPAKEQLELAINLDDNEKADYLWLNGLLLAAKGNLIGAEQSLAQAAASANYDILMDWGRVAWQGGNYETALTAFEQAAQTEEGQRCLHPYMNQARLLIYQERYEEAIASLDNALDVYDVISLETRPDDVGLPDPAYIESYYRLGEIYEALGDVENAISNYEAASGIDPSFSPALEALERLR